MRLMRYSPAVPRVIGLDSFQRELDRVFDGFFAVAPQHSDVASWAPPTDLQETPEAFILKLDLPGVPQKDVKVSIIGNTLTIRGERKQEKNEKSTGLHRTERTYGVFERSFTLGQPVRNDQVQATYRDGVLEVRVPKAEEARVREIEVQVA